MNAIFCMCIWFSINYISFCGSNDVLGCGGFLKSHVQIDFSKVEVKLLTKQGTLKDKTNCAPNGYYFIPLYDKGEYILQLEPLPGWSFTPTKVNLIVDGKTDLCSQSKDIDFVFQGFGITGRVGSFGSKSGGGPEGVEVILSVDKKIRNTTTSAGGLFFFTPVYPGKYIVSISHTRWQLLKQSVKVTVTEGNAELPENSLIVQGYDVRGSIKSDGEPIENVPVLLFKGEDNKGPVKIDGCNRNHVTTSKANDNYLCYVTTNERGIFVFPSVSNGEYFIQPYYKGQTVHFTPPIHKFTVQHDSIRVVEAFEVSGFSVFGIVLNSVNGQPLKNAIVYVNGKEVATTNDNGRYTLEKIKSGTYTINVVYSNMKFTEKSIKIGLGMSELPAFYPSMYNVCGKVISESTQEISIQQHGSANKVVINSEPNTGTFCEYLTPGKYHIKVIKFGQGLQFFPITRRIEVKSNPIFDITFSQLKADVYGRVQCINEKDADNLKVHLISIHQDNNGNVTVTDIKNGEYHFTDVRPGEYELKLTENNFCWKKSQLTVTVNAAKHQVEPIEQTGYLIRFVATHEAQVSYEDYNKKMVNFVINKGSTLHCVERILKYKFNFNGCHIYEPKPLEYTPNTEFNEITVSAKKHKHLILTKSSSNHGDISFTIVSDGVKTVKGPVPFNNGNYELELYLSENENILLTPNSDVLYFTPKFRSIRGTDECKDLGVLFDALKGRVFKGQIIPPLAGVLIKIESENFKPLNIETDSTGRYKFPPLDDTKNYKISASKENYVLTGPDGKGNFLAHKLAEIFVEVVDADDNRPLHAALISLSGGESYRSNLQTNENGQITFHSLSPNSYFLRPMMKEYTFEPTSKIIDVQEGATINELLKGKRVAYSAFGQVLSLNGEPEGRMIVIASGLGNCSHYSEEATSETNGQFRIRGLQPFCSYEMKLKASFDDNELIERSTPDSIPFTVTSDIFDLKFIVYRPAQNVDILVKVYAANPEHYKTLRVKVVKESPTSFVVHTTKVDASNLKLTEENAGILLYLPSLPLDGNSYSILLESNLPEYKRDKSSVYAFTSNSSFQYAELTFAIQAVNAEEQIKQTSVWTLVFAFVLLVAVYRIDLLTSFLSNRMPNINLDISNLRSKPVNNELNDNMDIDKIVQSINATKRKPKPRKI